MNEVDSQYLNLLRDILNNGVEKDTRSGKVKSVFGRQMRFDLKKGFPLLTTKKVFYRGCFEELIWFLSGSTNIKYLVEKNVHIWDADAFRFYNEIKKENNETLNKNKDKFFAEFTYLKNLTKEEFLDKVLKDENFEYVHELNGSFLYKPYKFGDLGPVYGYQWRNFDGKGIDQIKNIIETLKNNPNDRRMLCVAFNPADLKEMALPPCHVMFQFYTRKLSDGNTGLSCMWTQRSVDSFLGLPFNIASYALLTHIIANIVDMAPDELIANLGDAHIYLNHLDAVNEQLSRKGFNSLPNLKINRILTNVDDLAISDFTVENYYSDPQIKAPLSVG